LPQSTKIFGKGAAGGAYKSFLAEQLAGQLSKAGGIGVASLIDKRVAAIQQAAATKPSGA
jgi:peptidoglycan hydrolase FlgJ